MAFDVRERERREIVVVGFSNGGRGKINEK
jgi:hypothetical protein